MYSAIEHLVAELQRLDLILLAHLQSLARDASSSDEFEHVASLLTSSLPADKDGSWTASESPSTALRRHSDMIRRNVTESLGRGGRLPIIDLCRAYGLDAQALGIVILACAPHIDRKYARVFAFLQGHRQLTAPRVGLAIEIFAETQGQRFDLRRNFTESRPLLRGGHIKLVEPSAETERTSLLDMLVHPSERLIRHLLGDETAEAIVEAMRPVPPLVEPTESQQQVLRRIADVWDEDDRPGPVVVVHSEDPEGIVSGTEHLAEVRQRAFLAVDLASPAARRTPCAQRILGAFREATLRDALLCVVGWSDLPEPERESAGWDIAGALAHSSVTCVLVGELGPFLRREFRRRKVLEVEAALPSLDERTQLWVQAVQSLHASKHVEPGSLAWRYRLSASEIRDAVHMATADASSRGSQWSEDIAPSLSEACKARSRRDLEKLAQPLHPRGAWSDLVLPEAGHQQLQELVGHLRHHELVFGTWGLRTKVLTGDGVAALFAGPPGTGKTMASSLIAQAIGRDLFRVDIAGVISKYIGETEKNLERVFAAAHRANAVLLFDEADALFGKRTTVRDAHDRYANVETSYLLQRIERFDGVVILATNFKKNIDEAFLRRISVVVDFPMPADEERRRLWRSLLPASMPCQDDLDYEFLAGRFELSGGQIKNAIQTAAMVAADENPQVVRFEHLLFGVKRELQKGGRIVDVTDFGRYRGRLVDFLSSRALLSGGA